MDKKTSTYIREIAVNILINDDIQLTDKEKNYLNRKIKYIKDIASRYISIYKRREIYVAQHLLIKKLAQIALKHIDDIE